MGLIDMRYQHLFISTDVFYVVLIIYPVYFYFIYVNLRRSYNVNCVLKYIPVCLLKLVIYKSYLVLYVQCVCAVTITVETFLYLVLQEMNSYYIITERF